MQAELLLCETMVGVSGRQAPQQASKEEEQPHGVTCVWQPYKVRAREQVRPARLQLQQCLWQTALQVQSQIAVSSGLQCDIMTRWLALLSLEANSDVAVLLHSSVNSAFLQHQQAQCVLFIRQHASFRQSAGQFLQSRCKQQEWFPVATWWCLENTGVCVLAGLAKLRCLGSASNRQSRTGCGPGA